MTAIPQRPITADSVDVLQLSASSHESAATTLNQDAGLFPTDLDDIASRLDARLTIASHGASSDAKPSPTKAPTRTSQHHSAGI